MAALSDDMKRVVDRQRLGFVATVCLDLRKGYRFKGQAKILDAGAEFERLVAVVETRRGLSDAPRRIRAIVLVRLERASAVISPGYDDDIDEGRTRERWTRYYLGDGSL